jgi:serine/threonine protein kinase
MEDLQGGALALEHRYDIGRPVGTIAFSSVYKGVQHPFDREVSIVVFDVLAESGASEGIVARIRASAEAYARLEHEGVVRAIDVGELDINLPFVVVDRAPGIRLASHFDSVGTMSPEETVAVVTRLAEILTVAHDAGIVHGSLAPVWIHVDPDHLDNVSVEHWGLGLTVDEIRSMEDAYMGFDAVCALPPEMFDDVSEPTVAGDVYALAAIAYRALAGIHPYFDDVSDTSEGLLRMQREDAAALDEYGADSEVAEVVGRGLARDPAERWPSVEAFAEALERAIFGDDELDDVDDVLDDEQDRRNDEDASSAVEQVDPQWHDEPAEAFPDNRPSPKGGLAALAFALLLVTNIGWYLFEPVGVQAETTSDSTEVLPDGVQVVSEPSGAKVIEIRNDREVELGETPMVIDPRIRDDERIQLKLTKRGFVDQKLVIRRTEQGNDVVVELLEAN